MKTSSLWTALAAASLAHAGCNANNCARAVTGTRSGQTASHKADCSSFMCITVTPKPVTTTLTTTLTPITRTVVVVDATATDTATVTVAPPALAPRQLTVRPSAIPVYASACAGMSAYSSACSCWGITASTHTAATPTVTAYATVSATVTVTQHTTTRTTTTKDVLASTTSAAPTACPGKDLRSDPDNCGACGNVCGFGFCSNGFCGNCRVGSGCVATVCSNDDDRVCICFKTPESGDAGICSVGGGFCNFPTCERSTDCPAGSICNSDNCCGKNICSPVVAICPNVLPQKRMFDPSRIMKRSGLNQPLYILSDDH